MATTGHQDSSGDVVPTFYFIFPLICLFTGGCFARGHHTVHSSVFSSLLCGTVVVVETATAPAEDSTLS